VMGAIAADLPAIFMPAGPMLRGNWRGQPVGSGTDVWRLWAERRAGELDDCAWRDLEDGIARSPGHCMTMGTASTMTAAVDALGLTLPGASSIPAVDAAHGRMAGRCGRAIVELVWEGRKPSTLLTAESFDNAVISVLALGGSTNAVIHLIAMARRAGVDLSLDRFDVLSRTTPVLADIRPGGRYLMEDFYYAGGLLALLSELRDLLNLEARTVGDVGDGSLGGACAGAEVYDREVIHPLERPVSPSGALAILQGSLAPDGAVIKAVAADPGLLQHRGPAVTFEDQADLEARIDDPDLPVTPDSVLVLKGAGPVGAPGMPEWGMLPIPRRLLEAGVRDMVRISDARMSGTSYGTCVLHVAPESAVGGPLAFVHDGDQIELDVADRRLDLLVPEEELARRRAGFTPVVPTGLSGYGELFVQHVTQSNLGCDFDFLQRRVGVQEPVIH
jgi:dihydroxyacid dehydratase/phosphogluconate dehydratase